MLPSELLRTRISRGRITPLFCTTNAKDNTDYQLANKLITGFVNAQKNDQTKGDLLEKNVILESKYDHRIVRGFFALLERRAIFQRAHLSNTAVSPQSVRQKLFEMSSNQGLALSASQRQHIIQQIASQTHLLPDEIEDIMWSDKEENLILVRFDAISPEDLILWYNLSLAQTLLFKCTGFEFFVKGGIYWKQVLRTVKKYGLMYSLEHVSSNDVGNDDGSNSATAAALTASNEYSSIKCVLDGPMSLFKMTDRYGTSMAKLLPSITSTPTWKINGSVVRRNDNGQKIYEFELSSENTKGFLRSVIDATHQGNQHDNDYVYDSLAEVQFVNRFRQYFDQDDEFGWKISREPDPLIANGKAMIPDFLFERFGRKVYLEIVGFWTKEYIDRKAVKLKALLCDGNSSTDQRDNSAVDLLVAVNSELSCSQIKRISQDRIFTFKKDVPLKPVLEHLKNIDAKILKEKVSNTAIKLDENESDVISIKEIACKHSIPDEAAVQILHVRYPDKYTVVESYLISKNKMESINDSLAGISEFIKACKVLTSYKIPDSCHARLLSELGYNVIWSDLDPSNAKITIR